MGEAPSLLRSRDDVRARYRVRLLERARPRRRGIAHREAGRERLLAWGEVARALAAEVGEPQGIRTIVFDLVLAPPEPGAGFTVCRFGAQPGDEAVAAARALCRGLPAERLGTTIKSLADEGMVTDWHPDLESFEVAALEQLS